MSTQSRQLAVIMFTDVVGFTTLMGKNEQKAMSLLKTNREIHKKIIKKHDGTWVKEIGDGTLGSFHTITDAVYCAGEIIQLSKEHEITLRIGIHFGEVMEEDGDIFGDGVNIASRLEPLAKPNQILVSDIIHRNIKNKDGIKSTFIEEKELKNVDEPIRIYSVEVNGYSESKNEEVFSKSSYSKKILISILSIALIAVIIALFIFKPWVGNQTDNENISTPEISNLDNKKTIAVLPFDDMSPEQDQEYLGDGIAEAIINRLTKVNGLKVIGRTSSFSFKGKDTDLKTIGKILGVETILEGSVQKYGNKLRITAQLINAEDESHFWSESFDREFSDILLMQDEISQIVSSKINIENTNPKKTSKAQHESLVPEAYELYLKGRFYYGDRYVITLDNQDYELSESYYKSSIALDSTFAMPHAGLAQLYFGQSFHNNKNYDSLIEKHIHIAYALNPNSEFVNSILATLKFSKYMQIDSAYFYYKRALDINPKDMNATLYLASFLDNIGLLHEALQIVDYAIGYSPLNIHIPRMRAYLNFGLGNFEDCENDIEKLLIIQPESFQGLSVAIRYNALMGNIDIAEQYLQMAKELSKKGTLTQINYFNESEGILSAAKGNKEEALKLAGNKNIYVLLLLGMNDEAIKFLLENENPDITTYHELKNQVYSSLVKSPELQQFISNEEKKYKLLKEKYGDLSFLNL